MFNFFKKNPLFEVFAPFSGECVSVEKVPDESFSQKMLGDGASIVPSDGQFVAPFDCEILQIFETKHAYILKSSYGLEVLIHIGIDTVELKGKGFDNQVSVGQKLSKGELISNVDLEFLSKNNRSLHTPIIFMNAEKFNLKFEYGIVSAGKDSICHVEKK